MKKTIRRNSWVLAGIVVSLLLAGCMSDVEQRIQGTWYWHSTHLENLNAEQALDVTWVFQGGTFYHRACCFNQDIELTGRYRIKSITEDTITIETFDVEGSGGLRGGEIRIEVDRENDTLTIINAGPYIRIAP